MASRQRPVAASCIKVHVGRCSAGQGSGYRVSDALGPFLLCARPGSGGGLDLHAAQPYHYKRPTPRGAAASLHISGMRSDSLPLTWPSRFPGLTLRRQLVRPRTRGKGIGGDELCSCAALRSMHRILGHGLLGGNSQATRFEIVTDWLIYRCASSSKMVGGARGRSMKELHRLSCILFISPYVHFI